MGPRVWDGKEEKKSDAWGMLAFMSVYSMPSASHTLSHSPPPTLEGEDVGICPQETQLGVLGVSPSLFCKVPATKLYFVLGPRRRMNGQEKVRAG